MGAIGAQVPMEKAKHPLELVILYAPVRRLGWMRDVLGLITQRFLSFKVSENRNSPEIIHS